MDEAGTAPVDEADARRAGRQSVARAGLAAVVVGVVGAFVVERPDVWLMIMAGGFVLAVARAFVRTAYIVGRVSGTVAVAAHVGLVVLTAAMLWALVTFVD